MSETLFSQIERLDTDPSGYSEPYFTYLEKSARIEMARVRDLLESWFTRYPNAHKHEFKRRCQTNNIKFESAFFELYIHELLLRLGYSVEVQPENRTANLKRPDFFVHNSDGEAFYLEATVASGTSTEQMVQLARKNKVYDAINKIDSPNFFLGMKMKGSPSTEPPIKSWLKQISGWLSSLDPDKFLEFSKHTDVDIRPKLALSHDGWHIEFFATPKSIKARAESGIRSIGMQMGDFEKVNSTEVIRRAAIAKAKKYGKLDKPYIIAINVHTAFFDRIHVMEALFGTEQYIVTSEEDKPQIKIVRATDGAWTSPFGPRYTRVTGVLIMERLMPSNIAYSDLCLYHNPWASNSYNGQMQQLSEAIPTNGQMYWKDGIHPRCLFGMPEKWPEYEEK